MTEINLKEIAHLARLHLTDDELRFLEPEVKQILVFVEKLKSLSVDGVEPTCHPLSLSNVFREDIGRPSLASEAFLNQAPASREHFFEVPKIIEEQ